MVRVRVWLRVRAVEATVRKAQWYTLDCNSDARESGGGTGDAILNFKKVRFGRGDHSSDETIIHHVSTLLTNHSSATLEPLICNAFLYLVFVQNGGKNAFAAAWEKALKEAS